MSASSTPREVVVQFDGLYFRIQRLRGRRALRGVRALQVCLGPSGYKTITVTPRFWEADEERQLEAIMVCESRTGSTYSEFEEAMGELLAYTPEHRGQGVSYRESPPDPNEPDRGWMPINGIGTLDNYDRVDHTTWGSLRWEMIKLVYRPTTAATGTNDGTRSAATTSTQASSPSGAHKPPPTGSPTVGTQPSGISGG